MLLAFPVRRELQLAAAAAVCHLHNTHGGDAHAAFAIAEEGAAEAGAAAFSRQQLVAGIGQRPVAKAAKGEMSTQEEMLAAVRMMAQLIDRFDVEDERRTYWWNRDGAHTASRLRSAFWFVLQAGGQQ